MQAPSSQGSRSTVLALPVLALGALLAACSGVDGADTSPSEDPAAENVATREGALAKGPIGDGPVEPGPVIDGPVTPRPPFPLPPRPPRPPVPTTEYCPDVNAGICGATPTAFTNAPFEVALKNAGCAAPFFYHSGQPHDYPFTKAALCPASGTVRALMKRNENTFYTPVASAVACDACVPKAPSGAVYVFFRRSDVIGPNCPNNCIDTPWSDEPLWE